MNTRVSFGLLSIFCDYILICYRALCKFIGFTSGGRPLDHHVQRIRSDPDWTARNGPVRWQQRLVWDLDGAV